MNNKKLSSEQQVVALLNSLGDNYRDIRNALEYKREELIVDITNLALTNRELELKFNFKDSENGVRLTEKKDWIKIRVTILAITTLIRGKVQNDKFKDRNKNKGKHKN